MQAYTPQNEPIGEAAPVPDNIQDFNKLATRMLKQPGADKVKIFIPVEQLRKMSTTQRLLFELKNKAKVVPEKQQ